MLVHETCLVSEQPWEGCCVSCGHLKPCFQGRNSQELLLTTEFRKRNMEPTGVFSFWIPGTLLNACLSFMLWNSPITLWGRCFQLCWIVGILWQDAHPTNTEAVTHTQHLDSSVSCCPTALQLPCAWSRYICFLYRICPHNSKITTQRWHPVHRLPRGLRFISCCCDKTLWQKQLKNRFIVAHSLVFLGLISVAVIATMTKNSLEKRVSLAYPSWLQSCLSQGRNSSKNSQEPWRSAAFLLVLQWLAQLAFLCNPRLPAQSGMDPPHQSLIKKMPHRFAYKSV